MKRSKFYKVLIVVLIILIACSGTYLGVNLYLDSFLNKIERESRITEEEAKINVIIKDEEDEEIHEVVNFLLLGVDNDDGDYTSFDGSRSDATKIISLDYTTKKIKITNLQRDVVVYIAGDYNKYGHLNWAYEIGGSTCTIQTVNYNLDTDITKCVIISFAGLINIIDMVGGVDVELTAKEAAAFNGLIKTNATMNIEAHEGINHLDGHDALSYARERYVDSDFVRVERQNTIIKKVIEKVKELSYSEILNLISSAMPYISTNLSNEEIKSYLLDVLAFDLKDIATYTWPNGEYDDVYTCQGLGGYLLTSYEEQLIELHKFIWEVDDYIPSKIALANIQNIYKIYGNDE